MLGQAEHVNLLQHSELSFETWKWKTSNL